MRIRLVLLFSLFLCTATSISQPPQTKVEAERPPASGDPAEADAAYRSGKFEAAAEKYRHLLQADPKNSAASSGLVRTLLKQKNIAEARVTIDRAIQAADSPELHVALGEVMYREGSLSGAEHEWVSVINSGHPTGRAYLGVARVSNALSLYKRARTMLEKAHELDPGDADIRKAWLGTLKVPDRIAYLEEYLAHDTADDEEVRSHMQHFLEYLRARRLEPKRGCHLVSNQTSTNAPLLNLLRDSNHLRGYGLEVVFGQQKAKLLLDTGAGGILINRRLAEKAGLKQLSETTLGGLGDRGEARGYIALAPTIKVGGLEFQDCPVEVIERRSVVDEDGLIGADVFQKFLVELDFAHQELHLSALPKRPEQTGEDLTLSSEQGEPDTPDAESSAANGQDQDTQDHEKVARDRGPFDRYVAPEMKDYTTVLRFGHLLLVPTKVNEDKTAKFFLIDSGSFTTQLSLNAARAVTKVHEDTTVRVRGLSGEVNKVFVADNATLEFAHLRQPTEGVMVVDLKHLSDDVGTEVSGIVGFTTLRFLDIKFDYRDGLVFMEYKGPKWMVR